MSRAEIDYEALRMRDDSSHHITSSSLHLAFDWLDHCVRSHPECRLSNLDGWIPTRLLEIDNATLRLRHRSQLPKAVSYATLSHRWRTPPCLILTSDRLAEFEEAVPEDKLSTVFLDAIDVTRRAGIQYLWIDSLCILQDSKDDWAHESALMGEVYKHGHFNIAATADAEGGDGLFADRLHCMSRPGHIKTNWTHISNVRYIWTTSEQAWSPPSVSEDVIHSRGWILQESYLSPRTIHFSQWQLQWECRHGFAAEAWPFRYPDTVVGPYLPKAVNSVKLQLQSNLEVSDLLFKWSSLVKRYMTCQLTRETDRLIAFSAVAREFAMAMNDSYVAGLWKSVLVSHLDWFVDERDRLPERPVDYAAPSWSWASIGTKTQFPARYTTSTPKEMVPLVQIVEASVDPELDDFGALRSGQLVVRGLLGRAMTVMATKPPESRDYTRKSWIALRESKVDLTPPSAISEGLQRYSTRFFSDVNFDTTNSSRLDQSVLLLPTILIKSHGDARILGILLQQAKQQPSKYERVGRFELAISLSDDRQLDMDYDFDNMSDDSFDGRNLHPDDPNYDTMKFWMSDLLLRSFVDASQSLFKVDSRANEYRLKSLENFPTICVI
jgi:hypothetical protein